MTTLVCTNGHTHEVQGWAKRPSCCVFTPCSQRFLSPQERAAATRRARLSTNQTQEVSA